MFVIARQAEEVILGLEAISQFQITITRQQQRDEITLRIESKEESFDRAKLTSDLSKRFHNACRLKIDRIEFVEKGSIPEKHDTIVDERTWD
jgi:phenylacetate-coenzyme A ligase PaaK-like adenylate-forming protein